MSTSEQSPRRGLRPALLSMLFPVFWMIFLSYPLFGAASLAGLQRFWGIAVTVAFAVLFYVAMVVGANGPSGFARATRSGPVLDFRHGRPIVAACLVGMTALAAVAVPVIGEDALSFLAYISVVLVILVRRVVPGFIAAASTVIIAEVMQRVVPGWTHDFTTTFGVSVGGIAMVLAVAAGDRARAARRAEEEARRAEEENRILEQEAERLRVSRDVHDVLGHSLTVIALKAQLAGKLEAAGSPDAGRHIAEIEQLARSALADVRRTVQGTREISLAAELVEAVRALRASGIDVDAPTSVDAADPALRELFAWAVREASTNILRHSAATRCTIAIEPDRLTVRNDGVIVSAPASSAEAAGPSSAPSLTGVASSSPGNRPGAAPSLAEVGAGSGLRGLRERARKVGAEVAAESDADEFVLVVARRDA